MKWARSVIVDEQDYDGQVFTCHNLLGLFLLIISVFVKTLLINVL
jgi:hypothetical protein